MSEKLERYLKAAADDLPTVPSVAAQVMRAVDDPDASIEKIRQLIDQDSAIAARILKISNSSFYGFPSEVQNLGRAISLIGLRTVRDLVLAVSIKGTYRRFGLMEKLLWEHSTVAAPVTSALARQPQTRLDVEDAFTAGLLHDIGKTALANSHRDEYEQVMARVYNEKISYVIAETDHFGFDHAELGAAVAERWNLPTRLVNVIRYHHNLDACGELPAEDGRLTALVSLSTACLTRAGVGRREPVSEIDITSLDAWKFLGFENDNLESFLEVCDELISMSRVLVE